MTGTATRLVQRRAQRGFTMIELMVSLIVLAILVSAALPLFRSFILSQRIKTASFDMMALLTFTRAEAIKRNGNVTLSTNPGGFTVTDPGGAVLRQQPSFTGIQLDCVNMTVNPHAYTICPVGGIVYNGNGRLQSAYLPMEIHEVNAAADSAASYRCITIDLSGRPNSKRGQC